MKTRGATLLELLIVFFISTMFIVMFMTQFMYVTGFWAETNEQAVLPETLSMVMNIMTDKLRFANPAATTMKNDYLLFTKVLEAEITGGHLMNHPLHNSAGTNTVIYYGWTDRDIPAYGIPANSLAESYDATNWAIVGSNIALFDMQRTGNVLTLRLSGTAKGNKSLPLVTDIRLMGGGG